VYVNVTPCQFACEANTTARSKLEVLRQLNAKLELEVWREHTSLQEEKNTELRKKLDLEVENFDLKYEVAKLSKELGNRIEEL
jgi:hypothetical protein